MLPKRRKSSLPNVIICRRTSRSLRRFGPSRARKFAIQKVLFWSPTGLRLSCFRMTRRADHCRHETAAIRLRKTKSFSSQQMCRPPLIAAILDQFRSRMFSVRCNIWGVSRGVRSGGRQGAECCGKPASISPRHFGRGASLGGPGGWSVCELRRRVS